jgi:hypothetical protein
MTGSLYLGSQKVCPAISLGGPEPTEYFTFKFPDGAVFSDEIELPPFAGDDYIDTLAIDFNKIEQITGRLRAFIYDMNPKIVIKGIENLKTISNSGISQSFQRCTLKENHTNLYFSNLESVGNWGMCFSFILYNMESVHFPKLKNIGSYAFGYSFYNNCHLYFDSVDSNTFQTGNEFGDMCSGRDGITLHLPSNLSSVIPTLSDYPNFGGTNTTILYDLPATE